MQGWFSQPDPFNWDLDKYSLATQARRFDNGTPSFLPYVASAPGLSWLLSPAAQGMRAHNQALSRKLIALADAKGYRLRSPRDASERGGSVMVELPAPIDAQALEARLRNRGRAGRHARPGAAPVAGRADAGRRDRRIGPPAARGLIAVA